MINYLFALMQTVTSTALLGTMNMIASTLGQNLLWGKISDRRKLRTQLIITGETTAAITYFIVYQAHRALLNAQANVAAGLAIIIGLSILEFFWSMSDVGWAALLADVTTTKSRGRIVGILNFIASLGRTLGIVVAGFLYLNGEGFRNGTIFYIVIIMLIGTANIMWITTKWTRTRNNKIPRPADRAEGSPIQIESVHGNKHTYNWFLISLTIIIIGATCVNQAFLLFLKLPNGLNASDPDMSFVLTAWTVAGMVTCLLVGWFTERFGTIKIFVAGLILAIVTPLLYGLTLSVWTMALFYGLNGISYWIIQTAGFTFAGDTIPEHQRGRLFSRYNAVMALSWGPAGLLIGGPLADLQTNSGLNAYTAYVNVFYASSIIVAIGALLFALRVVKTSKP